MGLQRDIKPTLPTPQNKVLNKLELFLSVKIFSERYLSKINRVLYKRKVREDTNEGE